MPTWTTAFTTPPALATLTATPDTDASAVVLAWSATTIPANQFWRYRIYRRDVETLLPVLIGEIDNPAVLTFTDQEAPHVVETRYLVTVSNGWAESDAIAAVVTLPLDAYWIIDPTDPTLVFAIPHVSGYSETWDPQAESFAPLDRDAPIVVTGVLLPPAGPMTAVLGPTDYPIFGLLKRAAQRDPWVVLKTPFGDVRHVKLTKLTKDRGQAGWQSVGFDYATVD